MRSRKRLGELRNLIRRLLAALDRGDYEDAAVTLGRLEELLAQ
jgi:hypothetical protein